MECVYLLILLVNCILGNDICDNPQRSIKQPKNAIISNSLPYEWFQNYRITYDCNLGYRFPDGRTSKYTKCIYNKYKGLQWSNKEFPDCYDFCGGNACQYGQCKFDDNQKKFSCQCSDHYGGPFCEHVVCGKFSNIRNGMPINGITSYNKSYGGVAVGTKIQYTCNSGYRLLGQGLIECAKSGIYHPPTPQCIPKVDGSPSRCQRQYDKPSLKETTLYKHAMLSNSGLGKGSKIGFSCRRGQSLLDHDNLPFHGHTTCKEDGTWSRQWPMCKVLTCKNPKLPRGTYVFVDKYGDGMAKRVVFTCYTRYYLYGKKNAFCIEGQWSSIPSCYTLHAFKNQCLLDGKIVEFQGYNRSEPVCLKPVIVEDEEAAKRQLKTITVVTSTAAVLFGVLLMIVAGVAFQRRRLLSRIRRFQEQLTEERDRANIDNDVYMRFMLPSYDEAEKDKPTTQPPTFDEAQRAAEENGQQHLLEGATAVVAPSHSTAQDPAPPPYGLLGESTAVEDMNVTPHVTPFGFACTEEYLDDGVYLDDVVLI